MDGYGAIRLTVPFYSVQRIEKTNARGVYMQKTKSINKRMSLNEFRELATSTEYMEPNVDRLELDRAYWSSLELATHKPIYADGFEGSLFDKSGTGWNLNKLGDILCDLDSNAFPGITSPFLYIGMWRTSFAMHTEDWDLCSINYLHFGKPKTWFIVPPAYGSLLEKLLPKDYKDCPAHFRHKNTIVNPDTARLHGLPVLEAVQEEGQFIITFPYAYHGGYNNGFNCAEAVNFATKQWVQFGVCASKCKCKNIKKPNIDMKPFVAKYLKG